MRIDTSWNALLRPWISNRYFDVPRPKPFEADAPDCSLINAWWLCELSRLIYRQGPDETEPEVQSPARSEILNGAGLREIASFSSETNHCAIVESRDTTSQPFAALVFRGTCGFEGWLSNLKVIQTCWPGGGSVHSGYKADFLRLWQQIESPLLKIDLPLFFTGHSLGGALAVLAASVFPAKAVYTFGAPKTGDAVLASFLKNARIYRFENARDIIPKLQPTTFPFGFCPVGDPVCLKDDFRTSMESSSIRRLTDPPEFLSDHAPVNYTIRLKAGIYQS